MKQTTLERTFTLLEHMVDSKGPTRFKDLSELLQPVAPATLSKLLKELCELGILRESDARDGYQLTGKLLDLGLKANTSPTLESLCREPMKSLNAQHHITVALMERQGDRLFCRMAYDDVDSPTMVRPSSSRSFAIQAVGSIFLYQPEELAQLDIQAQLDLDHCQASVNSVQASIQSSLQQGYFWDEGEFYAGVGRLALPLTCGSNKWVLAMGFSPFRLQDPKFKNDLITSALNTQQTLLSRLDACLGMST